MDQQEAVVGRPEEAVVEEVSQLAVELSWPIEPEWWERS